MQRLDIPEVFNLSIGVHFDASLTPLSWCIDEYYDHTYTGLERYLETFGSFSPDVKRSAQPLSPLDATLEGIYLADRAMRVSAIASGHPDMFPDSDALEESIDLGFLSPYDLDEPQLTFGHVILKTFAPLDEIVESHLEIIDPTKEHHARIQGAAGYTFSTLAMIMSLEQEANQQ